MNDTSDDQSSSEVSNEVTSPVDQNHDILFRGAVFNRHFDEAIDVEEDSSFETDSSDKSCGGDLRESRSKVTCQIPNGKNTAPPVEASTENAEHVQEKYDYDQLPVSDEIKTLFRLVDFYVPEEVEIVAPLKCFVPNYIPAIVSVVNAVSNHVFQCLNNLIAHFPR